MRILEWLRTPLSIAQFVALCAGWFAVCNLVTLAILYLT